MATLVACLAGLRSEFNAVAPNRDKASDGWIGDTAHSSRTSDHNPDARGLVHAIDVDIDLRQPGLTMEMVVQRLLARCRSGAEKRLRYIIFNRRIWSASSSWKQQAYSGSNPHDHHAHFSASYEMARERDTSPWHLIPEEELDMALDTADKNWMGGMAATNTEKVLDELTNLKAALTSLRAALPSAVWTEPRFTNPYTGTVQPPADFVRYAPSRSPHEVTQAAIAQLAATVGAFITAEAADDAASAAALQAIQDTLVTLAPAIAAQVIAALPDGAGPVSLEMLVAALEQVIRGAFTAPTGA